jgi:hypothetical protein
MKLKTGLLLALLFMASPCHAGKTDALPIPPKEAPEIVAADMRYNGAPMQIVQFTTQDPEKTLAFYRKYFVEHAREGKYAENGPPSQKMIGAMMEDKRLINVEMRIDKKEAAQVLVSSLDLFKMQDPEALARDFPRMPGSRVIQHQDSRDGKKSNRFVVMENRQSVEGNAMYLREHYLQKGWRRDRDDTLKPGQHRLLGFSKENRQVLVNVQKKDQDIAMIIYNEMTE